MVARAKRHPRSGVPSSSPSLSETPERRLEEIRQAAEHRSASGVELLLRELSNEDARLRRAAAWGLGSLREAGARSLLEAALSDPSPEVRSTSAEALGSIARPESREPLERSLADPVARVREQAAWGLWAISDPRSVTPLVRLFSDSDAAVRWSAATAVGRLGTPEGRGALTLGLQDPSDRVRRECLLGLGRPRDASVAPLIRPFLRDPARRVRVAAAVVLGRIGDQPAVPALLERLENDEAWVRPAVLVALGRIGDRSVAPALVRAAGHPASWVRVCALHALGLLAAPEGREIARSCLTDKAWAVRGAAADCLGKVGDASDLVALMGRLEDPHPWPRRGALYSIGRLRLSEAAPRVREELHHPEAEVRLAAVWALGCLKDDGAKEAIAALLKSARPQNRSAETIAQGDGAVQILSDAEERLFDTAVQALGRIAPSESDPTVVRALLEARGRIHEVDLDRPARLPGPEEAGTAGLTLRLLFDAALPGAGDEDEIGC